MSKLCSFSLSNGCKNSKCMFVHVDDGEKQNTIKQKSEKKTDIVCKGFANVGSCKFGDRCKFIHVRGTSSPVNGSKPVESKKNADRLPLGRFGNNLRRLHEKKGALEKVLGVEGVKESLAKINAVFSCFTQLDADLVTLLRELSEPADESEDTDSIASL